MNWSASAAAAACPPPDPPAPLRPAAAAGDTSAEQRSDPSPGRSAEGAPRLARAEAVAVGPSAPSETVQAEPSGEKEKEGARTSCGLRPLARRERWEMAWGRRTSAGSGRRWKRGRRKSGGGEEVE